MRFITAGGGGKGVQRLHAPLRAAGGALGALMLAYLAVVFVAGPRLSGDLLPLWLAGQAFAEGAFDQVYAPVEPVYRMLPPDGWIDRAQAAGHAGFVYPFVYPPLWAWAFGLLAGVAEFQTVAQTGSVLNPALLLATCLLARRAGGATLGLFAYVAISQVLLYMTAVGRIAILQNQVQILVSFLIVLAIERAHAGRPVAAGLALALAASIKLYPAVFALFWLAAGERRAFGAFAAAGLMLGLASVAVAGWPLHAQFLAQVSAIGNTGFFSPLSFSLDGVATRIFGPPPVPVNLVHTDPETDLPRTILVSAKTPLLSLAGTGALVLLTATFALAMRRAGPATRAAALWPAALTLFPLIGSLAWGYYFIAATAFAPSLIGRFGPARGGAILLIVFAPIHIWAQGIVRGLGVDFQFVGAGLFLILGLAFLAAARGPAPAR